MTKVPIRVVDAKQPPDPLRLICSRDLALRIGALPPGYFFGTCVGDPVMLVEPSDRRRPGLIWPLHNGCYLGTDDPS